MSLVAYAASSDEGSDSDESESIVQVKPQHTIKATTNGHISDEEEYFPRNEGDGNLEDSLPLPNKRLLNLPAPAIIEPDENDENIEKQFAKLPAPATITDTDIIEEDDEFLHKKADPFQNTEKPPPNVTLGRVPVKITIPSLSEFKDVDEGKTKTKKVRPSTNSCGLLGLLPIPKYEMFTAPKSKENQDKIMKSVTSLVPDSVKNPKLKSKQKILKEAVRQLQNPLKPKTLIGGSDSEGSEDEGGAGGDFFSLNKNRNDLPEVSTSEINAMIAKRVAKMAEASSKINEIVKINSNENSEPEENIDETAAPEVNSMQFDEEAMQALVGSRAKRRKVEEVNVVELSSDQVLPNKDEWLRQALASSTTYQPMGVLTDEEPAPGTRKKHQITYLAHQAKANEQELQAMWAANRHTRRQTQSKYGF